MDFSLHRDAKVPSISQTASGMRFHSEATLLIISRYEFLPLSTDRFIHVREFLNVRIRRFSWPLDSWITNCIAFLSLSRIFKYQIKVQRGFSEIRSSKDLGIKSEEIRENPGVQNFSSIRRTDEWSRPFLCVIIPNWYPILTFEYLETLEICTYLGF